VWKRGEEQNILVHRRTPTSRDVRAAWNDQQRIPRVWSMGHTAFALCTTDFFTSVINVKLINAIFFTVMVYVISFFFWACVWYLLWRRAPAPCPDACSDRTQSAVIVCWPFRHAEVERASERALHMHV